jgi:hypothetical protein
MKKLFNLLLFAFVISTTSTVWAYDTYQGGCACYGQQNGINIEECARSGFGNGTGVRVQAKIAFSNGLCGADGGILAFLPKLPNKIFGIDLKAACDRHDIEYGTCGLPKDFADTNLGNSVRQACEAQWHPKMYRGCGFIKNVIQTMVEEFGIFAYRAAQSALCACSPCGPELARMCFLGGPAFPGPIQWPPWEPLPPGGGFGGL